MHKYAISPIYYISKIFVKITKSSYLMFKEVDMEWSFQILELVRKRVELNGHGMPHVA